MSTRNEGRELNLALSIIKIVYEAGDEAPEILGSGSTYSNVKRFRDENKAFEEYKTNKRDYLHRKTYYLELPFPVEEWWDDSLGKWRI